MRRSWMDASCHLSTTSRRGVRAARSGVSCSIVWKGFVRFRLVTFYRFFEMGVVMSQVQTLTPTFVPTATPKVRNRQPVRTEAPAALYRCLIVSASHERMAMLRDAAAAQGWDPILCHAAEQASREAVRHRLQMVIVDLERTERGVAERLKDLAEQFADESERLLVVCGTDGDVMEEIWARQLGAWMYLPGVDDTSDVAMVCGEAKNVAEKLLGARAAP